MQPNRGLSTTQFTLAQGMAPKVCANEFIFQYPTSDNLNYCCPPNTALVGTSPFMALKGAPGAFINTSSALRPQSTIMANGPLTSSVRIDRNSDLSCLQPLHVRQCNPVSARAAMKNAAFEQVYLKNKLL